MTDDVAPRVARGLVVVCLVAAALAAPVAGQISPDAWRMHLRTPDRVATHGAAAGGTGELLWNHTIDVPFSRSSPAVVGDKVLFGSRQGVHAVDRVTGEGVWQTDVGGGVHASPVVADGTVYVGTWPGADYAAASGSVVALDLDSGEVLWTTEVADRIFSTPAVVDGTVYVGTSNGGVGGSPTSGDVVALDGDSGDVLWMYATGGLVRSSPAVVDGTVYVGSGDDLVYALDAATGQVTWRFPTLGDVASSPAVADGRVYVASCFRGCDETNNGTLHALDAGTGTEAWSIGIQASQRAPIAFFDGIAYFGTDGGAVWAVRDDGDEPEVLWVRGAFNKIQTGPAVSEETVFATSVDHHVYAIDRATGNASWRFAADNWFRSSPAVVDGRLYAFSWYDLWAIDAGVSTGRDDGSGGGPGDGLSWVPIPTVPPALVAVAVAATAAVWARRRRGDP